MAKTSGKSKMLSSSMMDMLMNGLLILGLVLIIVMLYQLMTCGKEGAVGGRPRTLEETPDESSEPLLLPSMDEMDGMMM
tara:strand:+ start:1316 stop:1552 length:237 start_codon:yes stop_codon:yes gene_type:complete